MPLHLFTDKTIRDYRFMSLFGLLLMVLIVQTVFNDRYIINIAISLVYLFAILSALSASGAAALLRYQLFGLWLSSNLLKVFFLKYHQEWALIAAKGLSCAMLSILVFSIARYVLISHKVTEDTLFAAIVAYLLFSLVFSQLYSGLALLIPHAFHIPDYFLTADGVYPDYQYMYFSFCTMTTVGYGDITPSHPLIQILAAIQAVMGQFYVAMIVAWLVSLYIIHHNGNKE
jgi:voltage-gated potassium channel